MRLTEGVSLGLPGSRGPQAGQGREPAAGPLRAVAEERAARWNVADVDLVVGDTRPGQDKAVRRPQVELPLPGPGRAEHGGGAVAEGARRRLGDLGADLVPVRGDRW